MNPLVPFIFIVTLLFPTAELLAGTRTVELQINGVTALADLVAPEEAPIRNGVVLVTHGTLAHKDMEIVEALQAGLAERGIASLAHTLTLGVDRREGMYDCGVPHTHRHEDALAEIRAWIDWLKKEGAGPITLLGHSRGGNQVAWFAAEHAGDDVSRVVLMAPATAEPASIAAKNYRQRFNAELDAVLNKAKVAAAGNNKEMMDLPGFVYCPDTKAQAGSVVSYYGDEPRRDTPSLLPGLKMPTLVIAAAKDSVMPDVAKRVKPLADDKKITLEVIEDADHMFLDFYAEDAVELIADFIKPE